jgi:NitT/TauT family transport system substrate-binding protein
MNILMNICRYKMRMVALVALATLVVGSTFASAADKQPLTKIRFTLDWHYGGHLSYFLMAKAKGYYEKEGLDVTVDSGAGSGATISRILGGAYDMGSADMSTVIEFLGNNPDMAGRFQAVYLLYSRTPMIVQTLKKTGIRKPQDLAGKTMASPIFDSTRKSFPIFAAAVGIDPKSIKWQSVDPSLRETLLARGDVDAIPGMEVDKLTLMALGVKESDIVTFGYADAGVKLYGNVILASSKLIKENPKAVAGFLRATNRALVEAISNPAESASYTKKFDPLTDPKIALAKLKIQLRSINTDFAHTDGLGAIDMKVLSHQVDDLTTTFALKTKPNVAQLFNASFLPPKAERIPRVPAMK